MTAIGVDDLRAYTRRVLARDNPEDRDRRRHRRRHRRAAARQHVRRTAGQGRPHAGGERRAAGHGPPHRRRARRAAGRDHLRRTRHRPQRSGLHGRLYRQPHPRRRLVLVAALWRSAREARPGLWRVHQPGVARAFRAPARRHRHPRRRHRRDAEDHRGRIPAAWPTDGPTEDEVDKTKTYLKGSFALGLDTSSKIAAQLVQMQTRRSRHRLYRAAARD